MKWIRGWGFAIKHLECSTSHYVAREKAPSGLLYVEKRLYSLQRQGEYPLERNISRGFKLPSSLLENIFCRKCDGIWTSRRQFHSMQNDPNLSRDFFVQLWVADRKKLKSAARRNQVLKSGDGQSVFKLPLERLFSGTSALNEKSYDKIKSRLRQPPTSQSVTGLLSLEESMVAPLLARSNLLITRDIEWANLVLGFEQENRYAIVDACYPQSPVGFIREQSNWIARQAFRLRRPFVASITNALGIELFRVRRPFWFVTSSIYAEINGKEVGVVHRRWHPWRRIYELYLGNKQFAEVVNPGFWNWTFTLKDIDGNVLAEVDRDWRGFGFEILTDAGQYVIRFGTSDPDVAPARGVKELSVSRPLSLSERAVAVALAISLDNDYFSRHGGWGLPVYVFDD